jgi:homopolymeric O-antigen transport system permease protein
MTFGTECPMNQRRVDTAFRHNQTMTKPAFRSDWIQELWRHRELFYFLAWRDIKLRYKQTVLGVLWALIQPLFTMLVFTLFFGNLAKIPSDGAPYPLFYIAALLPWTYFSTTLATSGNSLVTNSQLITKVYFPRAILPASGAMSGLLDFAIGCLILVGLMVYYGVRPDWAFLLWPMLLIPLVVLTLGISMILASLNVRYRDIKYALPFMIQLWLFVTPVIYPTGIIPERFRVIAALNPLTGIIDAFRNSVISSQRIDWQLLMLSSALTVVIFVTGLHFFRKTERTFADIV